MDNKLTAFDMVVEAAGVPPEDPKKESFNMALFMFISLSSQAEDWSYVILGNITHEFKAKLNIYLTAAKSLRKYCEKHIDYDQLGEDSMLFSQILEYIKNAKTAKEKQSILLLLQDFVNGNVLVCDDDTLKGQLQQANTQAATPQTMGD